VGYHRALGRGVQGYRTWGAGATQYAVGVELGYLVWKNLWLSLGCNAKGFDAPDLAVRPTRSAARICI